MSDNEHAQRRAESKTRMERAMRTCLADTAELERMMAGHPLPWTWTIGYYDGLFYQFLDAAGKPCLGNNLRDPEDAAFLLTLINSKT